MCNPVTATSLALSAAGTYMQQREAAKNQNRITDAKNNTYQTEMIKQRQFADETGAAFNHNVENQGREAFDQKAQDTADQVKQAFASVQTQPDYNIALPGSTPKNVVISRQNEQAKKDAQTERDVNNNATLQGYGGAMFSQGLDRNEFARLFGNTQDEAAGQTRLLPIRLQAAANNASKAPSLFPTLLKGAGMALGMYGAANGITSFGDKMVEGPVAAGAYGPGLPTYQPGLFTKLKTTAGSLY